MADEISSPIHIALADNAFCPSATCIQVASITEHGVLRFQHNLGVRRSHLASST